MKFIEVLRSFLRRIDAEDAVDYVCGTEALPLPFSPQEEREMLEKLEKGEEVEKIQYVDEAYFDTSMDLEEILKTRAY